MGRYGGLFIGLLLMTVGAGRLSETDGSYLAYFGGAAVVSLLVQALAGWRHDHRLGPDTDQEELLEETADLREA